MRRCPVDTLARAKAAARTLTTLAIAVTATVVMTLAGCASSAGIASTATLVDPARVGVAAAASPSVQLPLWPQQDMGCTAALGRLGGGSRRRALAARVAGRR